MIDLASAASRPGHRGLSALACLCCLALGASQANAVPGLQTGLRSGFLLAQAAKPDQPPDAERPTAADPSAPFAELNDVLEATQGKLDELFEAAASIAERRKDAEALKQANERLAAELEQANERRAELETSSERAEARIVELTSASDAVARKATRLDEELAKARRQSAELEQRLARADAAREAVAASVEKGRTEMQAQLDAATGAAERSGAEAQRLSRELAEAKEQLDQAAGATAEAERARQQATSEAQQLRGEAGQARAELAAARGELDRVKIANRELEQQIASLNAESNSAMETARQTLTVMEQKIEELNAALAGAGFAPTAAADEGAGAGTAQASPEPGDKAGAEPPVAIAAQGPAAQGDGSGLSRFEANVQYLNSRAVEAAGTDLFSGIRAAGEGVVHVSTTQAWRNIPPAGQRSYLDSLFDLWTVAQEGSGPAVVRIIDSSGRVLLEKSGNTKGDGD